jgi:hypothetical protein
MNLTTSGEFIAAFEKPLHNLCHETELFCGEGEGEGWGQEFGSYPSPLHLVLYSTISYLRAKTIYISVCL